MIIGLAAALLFGVAQDAPAESPAQRSPLEIVNATKFDITYQGNRVTSCTITATSGHAQVDRYVCDAARSCGNRYSAADRRASCLAKKREEFAEAIAKQSDLAK